MGGIIPSPEKPLMNVALRFLVALVALSLPLAAQTAMDAVKITTKKVSGNVYAMFGYGGNLGVLIGDDGPILIDDQFAPLSRKIVAAIAKLTDKPVRFLINTHWHFDHTGGNENFGKQGSVIVAHKNVRKRMSTGAFLEPFKRQIDPAPEAALPKVTFTDEVTFHWNDETVHVFHVKNAHTDGDCIIHFKKADVFHMGDCYFNGMYPFVDPTSGGHIDGVIATANKIIGMCKEGTKIIPGHGPLSGRKELVEFRDMLLLVKSRITKLVKAGKTVEEIVAAKPTADLDEAWGNGFFKSADWVAILAEMLGAKKEAKKVEAGK